MTYKPTVTLSASCEFDSRFNKNVDTYILTDTNGKTVDRDTDETALRQRNRNKYRIQEI